MYRPPLTPRPSEGRFPYAALLAALRPSLLAGSRLEPCVSCLHLLRFSGRSRTFVAALSLRPGAALNHPHYSRTTPAVEVREYRRNSPITCTVCYHGSCLGKVGSWRRNGRARWADGGTPHLARGCGSLREAAGLTQEELAEKAGLRAKSISDLERGVRKHPYPHTVRSLADALKLSEGERTALFAAVPKRGE